MKNDLKTAKVFIISNAKIPIIKIRVNDKMNVDLSFVSVLNK